MTPPAKRKQTTQRWGDCDRLSNLPNALLIHIFGFLNTKQAVQSCVLSKQWVQFWTLLPDLDFSSSHFRKLSSFDEFVNKVLTHRDSSVMIRGIKFSSRGSSFKSILSDRIVDYVSCHSLRTMKLEYVRLERSLCLKSLVSLYLYHVKLSDNFSDYPNLEQLSLHYCSLDEVLFIVAPRLSRLHLHDYHFYDTKLVLSTPRLTFMKFVRRVPCVSQTDGLPLLEAIDVEFYDTCTRAAYELEEKFNFLAILKCCFNVKRMRLSYRAIQILSELLNILDQEPSPFRNIEVLNIIPSLWCKPIIPVHVMTYLLGNSPHAKIVVEEERPRLWRSKDHGSSLFL